MDPIFISQGGITASVTLADGVYVLYWCDGVVNEWEEQFDALDVALARLALLSAAIENHGVFRDDEVVFAAMWHRLTEQSLDGADR